MIRVLNVLIVVFVYVSTTFSSQIALSEDLKQQIISLTNTNQLMQLALLPIETDWASDLEFHPSGEFLAILETSNPYHEVTTIQGEVGIWQVLSWNKIATLKRENSSAVSMAFHPSGRQIAIGNTLGELQLWDWESMEVKNAILAHESWVTSLSFESDGGLIISTSGLIYSTIESGGNPVVVWFVNPLSELTSLVSEGSGFGGGWYVNSNPSSGIRAIGMTDGRVRLWGSESTNLLAVLDGYTREEILFTPDGSELLFPSYDGVHIWSIKAALKSFGYIPEYRLIAPIVNSDVPLEEREFIFSIALNPDGGILAAGYQDGTIRLWDMQTGERLMVLEGHEGRVPSLAFSPDGTLLASGGSDGTVRLWGISAGE